MDDYRRGGAKSFAEIQAEQQHEQRLQQQQQQYPGRYGGGGGGSGISYHRSSSGGSYRSAGGGRRGGNRRPNRDHLPLEHGVVCSLKENFGFIHCADREAEVFFHYSEVQNCHPDDLRMDDEVEFRIGPSAKDSDKLAAYEVNTMPDGTIQWEIEDTPGKRYQGLVSRGQRTERGATMAEGTIRYSEKHPEQQGEDQSEEPTVEEYQVIKFREIDFDPEEQTGNNNSEDTGKNGRGSGEKAPPRLFRGDVVEFSIFTEKRSNTKYATKIVLLQSERERARLAKEKKMLEDATLEQGVVVSLKSDFGFLKSNRRKEEVYFHYSSVISEETEKGEGGKIDIDFQVGQDMEFLVVTDPGDGGRDKAGRSSARNVTLLPKGTVEFSKVLAEGVVGYVAVVPPATDSPGAKCGSIRLVDPVKDIALPPLKQGDNVVEEEEPGMLDNVLFAGGDSPGGFFLCRGGSSMGLWIREGDKVLFDVVKEYVDGGCYARPTKYLVPKDEANVDGDEEKEMKGNPAVRLIALSLAGRAEGVVHTIKEAYGFIHYAERPVDVHFKLFEILPDSIQADLRRNLGIAAAPTRLMPGTEVQFDLSVHGTVMTQAHHSRGKKHQSHPHERENLKAQRILLLPPKSVTENKTLGTCVRAKVIKEDHNQPYAGTIEFEQELEPMTMQERHPLVATMLDQFEQGPEVSLVYHDIQSPREDDVVLNMIETKVNAKWTHTHIPLAVEPAYPGRLCIHKEGANATDQHEGEVTEEGHEEADRSRSKSPTPASGRKKKKNANKDKQPIKSIRFDKSSLTQEAKTDVPPGIGDVVTCDVVQVRRTGNFHLHNMVVVERGEGEDGKDSAHGTGTTGIGVVREVNASRKFGFISVMDETAHKRELLMFHFSDVVTPHDDGNRGRSKKDAMIHKGDEVTFTIGKEKKKRVAVNVQITKGMVPSKVDKNACKGYVLLEPTDTQIPGGHRPRSFTKSKGEHAPSGGGGRWSKIKEDETNKHDELYEGSILLLEDPSHMFEGGIMTHLHYKNGAIAIHGAGAPSTVDGSTNPRRGDLISFVKAKSDGTHVKDIRVVTRAAAHLVRGKIAEIDQSAHTGKFVSVDHEYPVDLKEVVSCAPNILKDQVPAEGILHEGNIYGICRTCDLKLESKLKTGLKQRPKLNLTVRKDRGGTIMAQSMMAKGPDGTIGFAPGWTTRVSKYTGGSLDLSAADPLAENV